MKIISKNVLARFDSMVESALSPVEGDLLVSDPMIMETCAPYIGAMCAEYIDGEWLYQPYDRYTDYMEMSDAETIFDLHYKNEV